MADRLTYGGICGTCNKAPACMYADASKRVVLECEEFDGHVEDKHDSAEERSNHGGGRVNPAPHTYTGLCTDCENRATCTFVRPQGGVWHCEEYR